MSYFIISNIIHTLTNYMSYLVDYLSAIAELERARQTEDLPRTTSFASLAYFSNISGPSRIAATGIRSSAPHEVAFQLDPMSRLMTADGSHRLFGFFACRVLTWHVQLAC